MQEISEMYHQFLHTSNIMEEVLIKIKNDILNLKVKYLYVSMKDDIINPVVNKSKLDLQSKAKTLCEQIIKKTNIKRRW